MSKVPLETLHKTIQACKNNKIKIIVCVKDFSTAKLVRGWKPEAIAFEEPSLIATGKSITSLMPETIEHFTFLLKGTKTLAGYNLNQSVMFFITFNLIDVIAQFFFREVYRFRPLVVSGDFDHVLLKPVNALFRVLMGGADVIDLITLPPLFFATIYVGGLLSPSLAEVCIYLLLLVSGFLITTAFHIIVISFGIITLEVDHTIMIYRDLSSMGRFPIDIYKEPLKSILTYFIPVALMMSFPAKGLMGLVGPLGIIISVGISVAALIISLRFWEYALKQYTSASS